jgi:hypothetical protein
MHLLEETNCLYSLSPLYDYVRNAKGKKKKYPFAINNFTNGHILTLK